MAGRPTRYDKPARDLLTDRQQEVLAQIAAGKTNGEIAQVLDLTLDGVKWHVREILAKLDVTSRDEAVEAWNRGNRRNILRRLPAFAALGAASVAVVAGVAIWLTLGSSTSSQPDDDLRVLIALSLAPEPGIKVIDLPSEEERLFLEDLGEVGLVSWSPTGENLVAHIPSETDQRLVFMSYPSGEYTAVAFEEPLPVGLPHWSPDGTRVAVAGDPVRFYTATGELVSERSFGALGLDAATINGNVSPWSPDSTLVLLGNFPGVLVDRDGAIVQRISAEIMSEVELVASPGFLWIPGTDHTLLGVSFDPEQQRVQILLLDLTPDGPTVTVLPEATVPDLSLRFAPLRPPTALLEQIEARAPADLEAVRERPIGQVGWLVWFESVVRNAGEPPVYPVLLQIGDIAYAYDGDLEVRGTASSLAYIVVLGAGEPKGSPLDDIQVDGCPAPEFACRIGVYVTARLRDGDIQAVLDVGRPSQIPCQDISGSPSFIEVCEGSTTGISRFRYELEEMHETTPPARTFLTEFEFRIALGELSSRMRKAAEGASDAFGPGYARVVGFNCSGNDRIDYCSPNEVNVSWLEQSGDDLRRVGVSFPLDNGGISGFAMLETKAQVERIFTVTEADDTILWSPADQ